MLIDDLELQDPVTVFNGGLFVRPNLAVIPWMTCPRGNDALGGGSGSPNRTISAPHAYSANTHSGCQRLLPRDRIQ